MEVAQLGVIFLAGVISFLSPCVLPLIPGYLGLISGLSFTTLRDADVHHRRTIFLASLSFVGGFLIVFVLLGAAASSIGTFLLQHRSIFEKIGGVILVLLGIQLTGVVQVPQFFREWRLPMQRLPKNHLRAFLAGLIFAFGWSPCIGPILGAILITASLQGSILSGVLQLLFYGFGIAVPLLIVALFFAQATRYFSRLKRFAHVLQILAGCLVILFGIFLFFGQVRFISSQLFSLYQTLGLQVFVR